MPAKKKTAAKKSSGKSLAPRVEAPAPEDAPEYKLTADRVVSVVGAAVKTLHGKKSADYSARVRQILSNEVSTEADPEMTVEEAIEYHLANAIAVTLRPYVR